MNKSRKLSTRALSLVKQKPQEYRDSKFQWTKEKSDQRKLMIGERKVTLFLIRDLYCFIVSDKSAEKIESIKTKYLINYLTESAIKPVEVFT